MVAHRDVGDVGEVGNKALPTPQHFLQDTDHSVPGPNIQEWLLLSEWELNCGEKGHGSRGCSGARGGRDSVLRGLDRQRRGPTLRDLAPYLSES